MENADHPKVSGDKEACAKLAEIAKPEFKVPQRWPCFGVFSNVFSGEMMCKLKAI